MQEVDIIVHGKRVPQFPHDGKLFVVAKPGTQYKVRVKNNSTGRIMAVTSIDGLSVLDGKPAIAEGPGYVIEGYNSYTIKGWRTSNDEVSPFEFSEKKKSYASKSEDGDVRNCGVIGVIIHAEKVKPSPVTIKHEYIPSYPPIWPYRRPYIYPYDVRPYWMDTWGQFAGNANSITGSAVMMNTCSNSSHGLLRSADLSAQSSPEFDIGTGFSESSLTDRVENTSFESSHIIKAVEIYYASEEQLRRTGVPVDKETKVALPQAFGGFCKPPVK